MEWDRIKERRPWVHQDSFYSVVQKGPFCWQFIGPAAQGFHLVFPAVGKNILYITSEHIISLDSEPVISQALPRWEGSELGSQFSVEHLFWKLQPEGLQVTISKSPPLAEVSCSRHLIPSPLVCLFPALICVYLSSVGSCPTLWIFLGYDNFFPFFLLPRHSFTTAACHSSHSFLLVPFSPTAIQAADSPICSVHVAQEEKVLCKLTELAACFKLFTYFWMIANSKHHLYPLQLEKGKHSPDVKHDPIF